MFLLVKMIQQHFKGSFYFKPKKGQLWCWIEGSHYKAVISNFRCLREYSNNALWNTRDSHFSVIQILNHKLFPWIKCCLFSQQKGHHGSFLQLFQTIIILQNILLDHLFCVIFSAETGFPEGWSVPDLSVIQRHLDNDLTTPFHLTSTALHDCRSLPAKIFYLITPSRVHSLLGSWRGQWCSESCIPAFQLWFMPGIVWVNCSKPKHQREPPQGMAQFSTVQRRGFSAPLGAHGDS